MVLVCACFTLTACLFVMGQTDNKEKELDAPTDIVIEDITKNAIFIFDVLYGEEGGGETEISIDGAVWIDFDNSVGCEMGGLTPNTEYTVYARQKGYGEYPASEAFTKKVTTLRDTSKLVPENVTATIYHGAVTLSGVTDEMEVSYDNGKTYVANKTYTYTEKGEKTILVRYKENADYLAGADVLAVNVGEYVLTNNYAATASAEELDNVNNVTTVSEADYLIAEWFKQTLNLDDEIWALTDGKLPELK